MKCPCCAKIMKPVYDSVVIVAYQCECGKIVPPYVWEEGK
jgi:hypothetical protein